MTSIFAPQQPTRFTNLAGPAPHHEPSAPSPRAPSSTNMESSHLHTSAQQQYPYQQHSSPAGPSTTRVAPPDTPSAAGPCLPRQAFSSPTSQIYPASTMAAVEATRARFFAQQSGTRSRTRPTRTGSTRSHKSHPLTTTSYRQNFFERCQRVMHQHSTASRQHQVNAFRKGADGATPGLFSDEMDEDDDSELGSSPPPSSQGEREEDDELTRRRILAEYARLKKIYELRGELEIGWIDPDQLSWLEQQSKEEVVGDPYWDVPDEVLEELWLESQSGRKEEEEEEWDDAELEEALARLPI